MAEQTTRRRLLEPILDQGIENTFFLNGRLLTAPDLKAEADAARRRLGYLGEAVGAGVAHGLEVRLVAAGSGVAPPVLSVGAGLAVNPLGQPLALPFDLPELALTRDPEAEDGKTGLFAACEPPKAGTVPTGTGAYVLVVAPASGFRGKVPVRGFGPAAKVDGCGNRFSVEGVRFRLEEIELDDLAGLDQTAQAELTDLAAKSDPASLGRLRNLLAHACFGTADLAEFPTDPFALAQGRSAFATYGALDAMRAAGQLTPCDVPLALLWWTTAGVRFVDRWAVRRRLTEPPLADPWPLHAGARRLAEAEATFLQFQDQLREMLAEANPGAIEAKQRFRYLPATGYLPLDAGEFDRDTFFKDLNPQLTTLDGAFLRLLILQGWYLDPIDLADPPPIVVYEATSGDPYLVFLRGQEQQVGVEAEAVVTPAPTTGVAPGRINVDVSIKKGGAGSGTGGTVVTAVTGGGGTIGVTTAEASYAATGIIGPAKAKSAPAYVSQLESLAVDAFDVDVDDHFVKVLATDDLGNVYPAKFAEPRRFTGLSKAGKTTFRKGTARFTIAGLPPGDYTVSAQLQGFKTASQHRTVESGKTLKVTFVLVRETLPGGVLPDKPDAIAPGGWIGPGWWGKLGLIPKYPLWPWPPPEERPGFDPVFDPPPHEVEVWLQDWAAWLKGQYPEAAIDPGGVHVYVARDHTPDSIPDAAYAYAVFGEGGAYLPVLLAPTDRAFPTDVPVAKGELAGIDAHLAAELAASGLGDLDLLAAGWTGLVGAALGVGTEAAAGVIAGSRTKVDELQGTLLTLGGVDQGLADTLAAVEVAPGVAIDSPVALANADPQVLATELAGQGMTLAFATRLVDEARRAVPASEWSLGAGGMGLNETEIAGLAALDVTSKGTLKAAATTKQVEIAAALALPDTAAVATLAGGIAIKDKAGVVADVQNAAPVTSVLGVAGATGVQLAGLGVKTLGQLKDANSAAIAGAFGGNVGMAESAIAAAKAKLGGGGP